MYKYILMAMFFSLNAIAGNNLNDPKINKIEKLETPSIEGFCNQFNKEIKKYYWGRIICNPKTWIYDEHFVTPNGWPLVYNVFNDSEENNKKNNTTLIMCAMHADELPAAYFCVHLVRDMLFDNPKNYHGQKVVVAPLINPDGFFRKHPTRTNGNGVDVNRNFPTKDFEELAIATWKNKYHSTWRKYPGPHGASEIETRFQMMLIDKYQPDKIIAVHTPLGWLDFDSPHKAGNKNWDEPDGYDFNFFKVESKNVAKDMSKKSYNYPLTSFQVYPGSLGNYAAKERGIPVYTLELPTSGAEKAHEYWLRMRKGIAAAISYEIPKNQEEKQETTKASSEASKAN